MEAPRSTEKRRYRKVAPSTLKWQNQSCFMSSKRQRLLCRRKHAAPHFHLCPPPIGQLPIQICPSTPPWQQGGAAVGVVPGSSITYRKYQPPTPPDHPLLKHASCNFLAPAARESQFLGPAQFAPAARDTRDAHRVMADIEAEPQARHIVYCGGKCCVTALFTLDAPKCCS